MRSMTRISAALLVASLLTVALGATASQATGGKPPLHPNFTTSGEVLIAEDDVTLVELAPRFCYANATEYWLYLRNRTQDAMAYSVLTYIDGRLARSDDYTTVPGRFSGAFHDDTVKSPPKRSHQIRLVIHASDVRLPNEEPHVYDLEFSTCDASHSPK